MLYGDIYYYNIKKTPVDIQNISFKTGDLLFYKWNDYNIISYNADQKTRNIQYHMLSHSIYNTLVGLVKGYDYTHIGIIIMVDNEPHVYECTEPYTYTINKIEKHGNIVSDMPSLLPLNYINLYRGHCYHVPYTGTPINNVKNFIENYKDTPFKTDHNMFLNMYYNYSIPPTFNCCTIVSHFLNSFNIVNFGNIYTQTPHSIYKKIQQSHMYDTSKKTMLKNNYAVYKQ
jgi:hypothetical protein